ncbi:MAG: Sir2 family NAD-dependent protein deacetylase, partial [Marmoricola sp.]
MADAARELLAGRTVVLTGAGLSTDSGIPDYRGPGAPVRMPMTYQDFVASHENQQRYWARAHLGWSRMGGAEPNAGHRALARLEQLGRVHFLITQNVDGLHERAGQRSMVALHGRISEVVCLDCGGRTHRTTMQRALTQANPGWLDAHGSVAARPDGDV